MSTLLLASLIVQAVLGAVVFVGTILLAGESSGPGQWLLSWAGCGLILAMAALSALASWVHRKRKGPFLPLLVAHAGLAILLAGAVLNGVVGKEGLVGVPEGQSTSVAYAEDDTEILLPFTLTLKDFVIEPYQGDDRPRSFESSVTLASDSGTREVRMRMNEPLREGAWAVYQYSWEDLPQGRTAGVWLVQYRPLSWLVYLGGVLLGAGLAWYPLAAWWSGRRRARKVHGEGLLAPSPRSGARVVPAWLTRLALPLAALVLGLAMALGSSLLLRADNPVVQVEGRYQALGTWLQGRVAPGARNPVLLDLLGQAATWYPLGLDGAADWWAQHLGVEADQARAFLDTLGLGEFSATGTEAITVLKPGPDWVQELRIGAFLAHGGFPAFLVFGSLFILLVMAWWLPSLRPVVAVLLGSLGVMNLTWWTLVHQLPPFASLDAGMWWVALGLAVLGPRGSRIDSGSLASLGLAWTLALLSWASGNLDPGAILPVLRTPAWLWIHVGTIILGYGVVLAAAVVAHRDLVGYAAEGLGIGKGPAIRQGSGSAEDREALLRALGVAAMSLVAMGTILGGYWADQSWGRFWGWDPKENGALILVLWLSVALHGRALGTWGPLGFRTAMALGTLPLAFSWFGVNFLGVGKHSYGFTQGPLAALVVFVGLELTLVWLARRGAQRRTGAALVAPGRRGDLPARVLPGEDLGEGWWKLRIVPGDPAGLDGVEPGHFVQLALPHGADLARRFYSVLAVEAGGALVILARPGGAGSALARTAGRGGPCRLAGPWGGAPDYGKAHGTDGLIRARVHGSGVALALALAGAQADRSVTTPWVLDWHDAPGDGTAAAILGTLPPWLALTLHRDDGTAVVHRGAPASGPGAAPVVAARAPGAAASGPVPGAPALVPDPAAAWVLAGPADLVGAWREALAADGVPGDRIHAEGFFRTSAGKGPRLASLGLARGTWMARAGTSEFLVQAGQSLLGAWKGHPAHGAGCGLGLCGTCSCRLVLGRGLELLPDGSLEERGPGATIHACRFYPAEYVEVEG